jgi:hypothetical protein
MVLRRIAMFAALTLGGCGLAPLGSEEVFRLSSSPHGWLFGTIVNQQTGAPLAGAMVSLESASARSDASGQYRVERISAVPQAGSVVLAGFAPWSFDLEARPGANRLDVSLKPLPCGGCPPEQVCDPGTQQCVVAAQLSGDVVDGCTGAALDAKVSIGGVSACTSASKGLFTLRGLLPGGPQTLAIGKDGYQVHSAILTLQPGFNAFEPVELQRIGGCTATPPATPCACLEVPACR